MLVSLSVNDEPFKRLSFVYVKLTVSGCLHHHLFVPSFIDVLNIQKTMDSWYCQNKIFADYDFIFIC